MFLQTEFQTARTKDGSVDVNWLSPAFASCRFRGARAIMKGEKTFKQR